MPPITVQVGERQFRTSKETLIKESRYFERFLPKNVINLQPEDVIFIDRDGDLFDHILCYLRTGVYPLFYDAIKGHDEILYHRLCLEADFFEIQKLKRYLSDHRYWKAVKSIKRVKLTEDPIIPHSFTDPAVFKGENGATVDVSPYCSTREFYICPRGIPVHMDNEDLCGRACKSAMSDDPYEQRTEYRFLQVYTHTEIRKEVLDSNANVEMKVADK